MIKILTLFQIKKLIAIILISSIIFNLNSTVLGESDWTMPRHDNQHTGYQPVKGSGNISNYGLIWAKDFDYWIYGEITVADIDLNGEKEIVFGNDEGYLYCLDIYGKIKWKFKCEITKFGYKISSAPVLYNITGNRSLEIIFGSSNGKVYCLSAWGKLIWEYQTDYNIESSPAIGDITGNGIVDIAILTLGGLYTLSNNGELIWKMEFYEGGITTPSIVDINYDGIDDIIFTAFNGKVYVITTIRSSEGSNPSQEFQPKALWSFKTAKPNNIGLVTSPIIIDINKDGKTEIIIGASDNGLYCLNDKGKRLWVTYLEGPIYITPAIADIDSDGEYEIIVGISEGQLYALNSTGDYLWHVKYQKGINCGLTISDIDGDGLLEITSIDKTQHLYGPDESQEAIIYSINIVNYKGETVKRLKYLTKCYDEFYGITVTDLQSDGKLEILMGTHDGYLYCYGEIKNNKNHENNNINNSSVDTKNFTEVTLQMMGIIGIIIIIVAIILKLKNRN